MKTEREIVYGILQDLRANDYNNDEVMSERYIRAMINSVRGKELNTYYTRGLTVSDEAFQNTKLSFNKITFGADNIGTTNYTEFTTDIPKIIRMNEYGMSMDVYGATIPILNTSEYQSSKSDPFQKNLVFAKADSKKVTIYFPKTADCITSGDSLIIRNHILSKNNKNKFSINLRAVLVNPDDADDYDWENDAWPFPSERLDDLLTNLLRRKLGVSQAAKSDEIQNNRGDSIRYHDNTGVNKTA